MVILLNESSVSFLHWLPKIFSLVRVKKKKKKSRGAMKKKCCVCPNQKKKSLWKARSGSTPFNISAFIMKIIHYFIFLCSYCLIFYLFLLMEYVFVISTFFSIHHFSLSALFLVCCCCCVVLLLHSLFAIRNFVCLMMTHMTADGNRVTQSEQQHV